MSIAPNTARSTWASVWPVIQRELRGASHTPFNYWVRVLTGAAAMGVFAMVMQSENPVPATRGTQLFFFLHAGCLALTLTLVPLMTADCLARERREGTLGLLFLTPLTASGVVLGKSLIQILRAGSLWLAAVPVFVIPITLGGLTGNMIAGAISLELSFILICLSSGLLVSSFVKRPYLAVVLAEILAWVAALGMIAFMGFIVDAWMTRIGSPQGASDPLRLLAFGLASAMGFPIPAIPATPLRMALISSVHLIISTLFMLFVVLVAARRVEESWQDRPSSRRLQWWFQHFCTELFQSKFRRKMKSTLETNPISWLQQYSWKSRLAKWAICLVFVFVESLAMMLLASSFNGNSYLFDWYFASVPITLALLLAVLYIYAGVSGFLVEKTSGALELILITPLTVRNIIIGRSIGLWKQFLPAVISILALQAAIASIDRNSFPMALDVILACIFFSIPIYATYAALRVKWMLGAIALTSIAPLLVLAFSALLSGAATDAILVRAGWASGSMDHTMGFLAFWFLLTNFVFVGLTFFLLHHSLSKRIYSF